MRTRLKNAGEVCHLWAQWPDRQENARASNIFFEGPRIFSYGRHFEIARFIDKETVFFNSRSYSSTTAKHQRYTRGAIRRGIKIFTVPDMEHHATNVRYLIGEVLCYREKALAANKRAEYEASYARGARLHLHEYYNRFNRKAAGLSAAERKQARGLIREVFTKEEEKILAAKKKRAEELERTRAEREPALEAARIKREEKKRAAAAADLAEKVQAWKTGAGNSLPWGAPMLLRINGEEVQTSKGAAVRLAAARVLFSAWKHYRESGQEAIKAGTIGHKIGMFEIRDMTPDQIEIGCHVIPWDEAARVLDQPQEVNT